MRITRAIDDLLEVIRRDHNKSINITKWFNFFVFDVMEDLAFSKNSAMVKNGEEAYIFTTIREDMWNIAFFSHLPWLLPFLKRTPVLNANYHQFLKWIQNQIDERAKVRTIWPLSQQTLISYNYPQHEPAQPDIFSSILAEFNQGQKTTKDRLNLHGDAQLIVIAGSDSTAATLTHIFFQIAHDESLMRSLQADFESLPNLIHDNLITVELLDAVINETLRLHPPVPSGTQRITPPEGLRIGDRHIPGDTIVQVPNYTVFRG